MLFLFDYVSKAERVILSERPLYYYFRNLGGAMMRPFTTGAMDQVYCWELAKDAYEKMENFDPKDADNRELYRRIDCIRLISVLLTAGRIALLTARERRSFEEERAILHGCILDLPILKIWKGLDRGYRIKAVLFRFFPEWYYRIYHMWKSGR